MVTCFSWVVMFFFFHATTTTKIYTLSLHDALPIWDAASTTTTLRLAAITRRAAAIPSAPAPITTMSASRGKVAAVARRTGIAAKAADADRKLRRVIVMSWFPETCGEREQLANLAVSDVARQPSW